MSKFQFIHNLDCLQKYDQKKYELVFFSFNTSKKLAISVWQFAHPRIALMIMKEGFGRKK